MIVTRSFINALRGRVTEVIKDDDRKKKIVKKLRSMERSSDSSARLLTEVIQILSEERDFGLDTRDALGTVADELERINTDDKNRWHQLLALMDMGIGLNQMMAPFSQEEWSQLMMLVTPEVFQAAMETLPPQKFGELMGAALKARITRQG
ncbi:MAG: hypothetical protein GF334_03815 [Candidatus Altiarchaeales archaeon]|nr:hypothetical protein [Candidatus Altiarchaeales archaeon]